MDLRVRKLKNIELNRLSLGDFKSQKREDIVVILDNIRSMNNIGSIFRTCDCLGIGTLYLCGITAKPPHREIYKTALGAEQSINWEYFEDVIELIHKLKKNNYKILGLEQTNNSIDLRTFERSNHPIALILGNEIEGIGEKALENCDQIIEIPQFGTKHSFNVTISCGIALWEIINKKQQ